MQIELTDSDDPSIRAGISALLHAYTAAALGVSVERRSVAVLLRDASGAVEGGLWGVTRWGWLNLEFAYLPAHRRQAGLGSAMLAAIERAAAEAGCRGVRTGSFSFQAPDFYVKRGYTAYGSLQDHPPGHRDIALYKAGGLGAGDTGMAAEWEPDPAHRATLRALLLAHNEVHAGPADHRDLAVVLRDGDGAVAGGLVGHTARRWLQVELFALPQAARRGGLGTELIEMAHDEARRRGAIGARLATASFQARPFYEKRGYSVYGTIPDYQPGGHSRFMMARRFT